MFRFLDNIKNTLIRFLSMLWSICTLPYRFIRSAIFALIYPATISSRTHETDILFQCNRDSIVSRHDNKCRTDSAQTNIVNFDLHSNIQDGVITEEQRKSQQPFIDAVFYANNVANFYDSNKLFVICADGNATCHEDFYEEHLAMVNDSINVVAFNPMGVGISTGRTRCPEDYKAAMISIIEHLHNQGIPYENIVLKGRSLGAAMCLSVARQYQDQNHRVKVFADRTFARLDDTAASILFPLYPIVKILINIFMLNMYPADDFNAINRRNPGDAVGISAQNDKIIKNPCNLYNGVDPDYRETFIKMFKQRYSNPYGCGAHMDDLKNIIEVNNAKVHGPEYRGCDYFRAQLNIILRQNFQTQPDNSKSNLNPGSRQAPQMTTLQKILAGRQAPYLPADPEAVQESETNDQNFVLPRSEQRP